MSTIPVPRELLEAFHEAITMLDQCHHGEPWSAEVISQSVLRFQGIYNASLLAQPDAVEDPAVPHRKLLFGLTLEHLKKNMLKVNRFKRVVIYSGQWHSWWRLGGGYSPDLNEAQVWDFNAAWNASAHCGPEKKIKYYEIASDCLSKRPEAAS